ncbi:YolD-like family protein [Aneurinibacillus terranovensis]|uniref:YolD-like family protein n=1 Tax=Aneurinibacillus terranovensis TaxID=278991 RepID=UPI00042601B8|nr:YolD-like family protein [Aneurinibacillus terranovensis]
MSKKLQENGLFESSRMMLPEHKEAYIRHQQNLQKKKLPLLDEQEIDRLSYLIAHSMLTGKKITVTLFDDFEERKISGKIHNIDQQKGTIKLSNEMGRNLISFHEIINIEE